MLGVLLLDDVHSSEWLESHQRPRRPRRRALLLSYTQIEQVAGVAPAFAGPDNRRASARVRARWCTKPYAGCPAVRRHVFAERIGVEPGPGGHPVLETGVAPTAHLTFQNLSVAVEGVEPHVRSLDTNGTVALLGR